MTAQMHNFSMWVKETDPTRLKEIYTAKLQAAGFGLLQVVEQHFQPQGYTALFLLSESHFAIHTFPEHGETYIELSSCVKPPFIKFIADVEAQ